MSLLRLSFVAVLILLTVLCRGESCQEEIERKLQIFAEERFNNDASAVFDHYDTNGDGVDKAEMSNILYDAGVSWSCRWAGKIVDHFDKNGDGRVEKHEL